MAKIFDYKTQKAKLDSIVQWFESEDVSIDEALAKYEEAKKIIEELEVYLSDTKAKIKLSIQGKTSKK
jgi:exodeoxyribonuclease VII small subunit